MSEDFLSPMEIEDPVHEESTPPEDTSQLLAGGGIQFDASKPWSVKCPQEIVDKHSGISLRFGRHADDSRTVFLTLTAPGGKSGTHLTFQEGGEILSMAPILFSDENSK